MIKADVKTQSVYLDGVTEELCVEATMILIGIKTQFNSMADGAGDVLLDLLYNLAQKDELSGMSVASKIDLSELSKQLNKEGDNA